MSGGLCYFKWFLLNVIFTSVCFTSLSWLYVFELKLRRWRMATANRVRISSTSINTISSSRAFLTRKPFYSISRRPLWGVLTYLYELPSHCVSAALPPWLHLLCAITVECRILPSLPTPPVLAQIKYACFHFVRWIINSSLTRVNSRCFTPGIQIWLNIIKYK